MAEPTLRRRLLLGLLAPLLTLLALSGTASYFIALHYADQVYDDWLYDSVSSLALALEPGSGRTALNLHGAAENLFEWDISDRTYFRAISSRDGVIAGLAAMPATPEGGRPYRQAVLFDAMIEGAPVRVASLKVAGAPGETVELQVAETEKKRGQLADRILLSALVPQMVLIAAAAAAIWFGVRRGLAPLDALTASIAGRTSRSLEPIPEYRVPREIQPLTAALNELLQRLGEAAAAQRKFVADAAHQLRTPLAALKLHLDQDLHDASPDAMRSLLARLRVSTERAARLSHQLLALARAEPEAARERPLVAVDLRGLAEDVGAQWVPQALRKDLDLGFSATQDRAEIRGDPVLLREAINNLLDNAIKYHPGGGSVTLAVRGGARPAVVVEDDGPGIPAGERPLVLQRFYRGDRNSGEGSGLGLAIVNEIAALHGASLLLEDGPGQRGVRVTLEFPGSEAGAAVPTPPA